MTMHNANNERIKRQYFSYLKEAKRHSDATVDAVAESLAGFEADSKFRDFKTFLKVHPEFVTRCMQEIRVLSVNQQTLTLFRAPDKATLLRRFEHMVRDQRRMGRRCLLVVDEVQNLTSSLLE